MLGLLFEPNLVCLSAAEPGSGGAATESGGVSARRAAADRAGAEPPRPALHPDQRHHRQGEDTEQRRLQTFLNNSAHLLHFDAQVKTPDPHLKRFLSCLHVLNEQYNGAINVLLG